jgi:hypothetical protein
LATPFESRTFRGLGKEPIAVSYGNRAFSLGSAWSASILQLEGAGKNLAVRTLYASSCPFELIVQAHVPGCHDAIVRDAEDRNLLYAERVLPRDRINSASRIAAIGISRAEGISQSDHESIEFNRRECIRLAAEKNHIGTIDEESGDPI